MQLIKSVAASLVILISSTTFPQSKLPDTWQPGMTLSMSYGGGMRYYSYKLQVSDTGSFFIENVEGRVTNYKLELTKADLDSLLAFLKKHRLDKIKTVFAGPMHDKGSEHVSLQWGTNYYGAGESYMQLIAEEYKEDYNAIEGYMYTLRESKKKKVKNIPGQEPPQ